MRDIETIVRAAQSGDRRAFEELVTRFEGKVYSMALRYTGSEQDAQDICQDVFLRVFRFLPQFNNQSQFSTWIYRIASNVCKDSIRKRSNEQTISFTVAGNDKDDDFELEVSDLRYSPENTLDTIELRDEIQRGILALSDAHREVIVMRDINGMSYDEIGRCLGLESGTVKSRLARARDKLRIFLCAKGNFKDT